MNQLMIATAIIFGIVFGAIGFIFYVFLWPIIAFGKKVKEARTFLKDLDKKYPTKKITNEMREEREMELINSGYRPHVIEKAQRLNSRELNQENK